jgi:hypothetical protein
MLRMVSLDVQSNPYPTVLAQTLLYGDFDCACIGYRKMGVPDVYTHASGVCRRGFPPVKANNRHRWLQPMLPPLWRSLERVMHFL